MYKGHSYRFWCNSIVATNSTSFWQLAALLYQEDCFKIFRDENTSKEEKDDNYAKCIEFAKSEGFTYRPKNKGKEKKESKTMITTQTTNELELPTGLIKPMLPGSLEDWTKKNQMCTTEQKSEPS